MGISDSEFVLPSTRTQWVAQMDNLVRRKSLYKLGARGVFGILEFCHFYVARLKVLILLPSHQKSKIREILRIRLAKIRADYSPFCGETFCDGIRCSGRRHASLHLEPNSSPEPNSKIEKHSLFGCSSKINTTLGNYEIPYDADSHRDPNFDSEFQYHAGLRVSLFDHFCTLFTLQTSIKGFTILPLKKRDGVQYIAHGRKQRCYLTGKTYEPRFRVLNPASAFFQLCLKAGHDNSLGKSPQETHLYLLALNIVTVSLSQAIRKYSFTCTACNLNKALEKRKNYLMQSLHPGPSSRLLSLARAESPLSMICIDLTGEYFYLDHSRKLFP